MDGGAVDSEPVASGLFVPVPELPAGARPGDLVDLRFAFRMDRDGPVAEAFSSAASLASACGPAQPWVLLDRADALRALREAGARLLVVDVGSDDPEVVDLAAAAVEAVGA